MDEHISKILDKIFTETIKELSYLNIVYPDQDIKDGIQFQVGLRLGYTNGRALEYTENPGWNDELKKSIYEILHDKLNRYPAILTAIRQDG